MPITMSKRSILSAALALALHAAPAFPRTLPPFDPASLSCSAKVGRIDLKGRGKADGRTLNGEQLLQLYMRCGDGRAAGLQQQALQAQAEGKRWAWGAPVGGVLLGVAAGVAWGQTRAYDGPANGFYGDESNFHALYSMLGAAGGAVGGALLGFGAGVPMHVSRSRESRRLAQQAAEAHDQGLMERVKVGATTWHDGARVTLQASF